MLKAANLITIDDKKHIILTDAGLKKAIEIYQRHQIITAFWIKLGVSAETASKDACRMEHDITDETFLAIKKFVGE